MPREVCLLFLAGMKCVFFSASFISLSCVLFFNLFVFAYLFAFFIILFGHKIMHAHRLAIISVMPIPVRIMIQRIQPMVTVRG
jgi:hypothetical protein